MRSDRWLGPVIALMALAWLAIVYAYIPAARNEGEPGPQGFPIVLGIALFCTGAFITASSFFRGRKAALASATPVSRREVTIVGGTFGLLMLYAFLMEKTGFLIATPIAVLIMMVGILRMRNWPFILLMAAGVTASCWLFFVVLLGAPMPHGSWLWLL